MLFIIDFNPLFLSRANKLLSSLNVKNNLTTQTGVSIFTTISSEYKLAFDNVYPGSNIWANSQLKVYLEGTVKNRLEASLNTTLSDITIWGYEELTALGWVITGDETNGYNIVGSQEPAWYEKVFKNTNNNTASWTKLALRSNPYRVYSMRTNGTGLDVMARSNTEGIRPVITVSKDVIAN